jgi:acrylyl-CoA reductase (NADPH)
MTFRAILLERSADGEVRPTLSDLTESQLPAGDVLVDVEYSSLNYKDGLVLKGQGGLVRNYPHVPGIDLAGVVAHSDSPSFSTGDRVVLTGWRVGEVHWGGYAERARVNADWLVRLPDEISTYESMAIGTAGLTAMLCVMALEDKGLVKKDAPILVTGAAGGVGSVAVALLAALGCKVFASTGRESTHDYLRNLGAHEIVDRNTLSEKPTRPLGSAKWDAAVDTVGGGTLANVLSQIGYGGAVAACGLAQSNDLPTTVLPFIIRGVSLLGIDSVMCPTERRTEAWRRLATFSDSISSDISTRVGLGEVVDMADDILSGQTRGRTVIDVRA